MMLKRIGSSFFLALLLAACVPVTQPETEAELIVINAPEERRVESVADAFVARIDELGTPGFEVVRNVAIAGVEQRSNLGGSRAVPSAARIARTFGAAWTLMLGPVNIEREVHDVGGGEVEIVVDLSVEGILVRGSDERVLANLQSRTFTGRRFAPATEPIPNLLQDPTVVALAARGGAALAPAFREVVASLVSESSSE